MLIKLSEYAEQRGVSTQAVRKAIGEGRITKGAKRETADDAKGRPGRPGWLIDPDVADQEWGRNTTASKSNSSAIKAGRQRQMAAARGDAPEMPDAPRGPNMAQAQAIKTAYQARLLQLEFEERSGKLVSAEEMKKQRFETGRRVRDAVLRIGPQAIGEIAKAGGGMTPDQRTDVLMVLERHLVQALEALADGAGQS